MVCAAVEFGVVVTKIVAAGFPEYSELSLTDSVFKPVESHINGFRSFLLDCAIHDAIGCHVVCFEGVGG